MVTDWQQALTVLLIVVPGFVYRGRLARLRGPTTEDRDLLGVRILRALAASAGFALSYVVVLGPSLTGKASKPRDYLVAHPRGAAIALAVLVFGIPTAFAYVQHLHAARRQYPKLSWKQALKAYNTDPTAWDFVVNRVEPGYVRVHTKDGRWLGGYAGEGSFYTTYPGPREIFVEQAWEFDDEGEFKKATLGTGEWIQCDDAAAVEFVQPAQPEPHAGRWSTLIALALVIWVWGRRSRG
ncbi:DUF6338 family protein [Mycobacterium sp. 050134]|uniref:DUF6338 family protein n=1 Tax=Mycobacterium sp. 050134 TaxID=3096111 RepID=UPI002EDA850E